MKRARFISLLIILWQLIAMSGIYPALLFPGVPAIATSLWESTLSGELLSRLGYSFYLITAGLTLGVTGAFLLVVLAMLNDRLDYMVETVVGLLHPLPGVALLPLFLLWIGTGSWAIIAVIAHAILLPLTVNIQAGLRSVPRTQLEVGRNLGLDGLKLLTIVKVPAALPYILTGVRIAWGRAWRAIFAAEMVFGASGSEGGMGWFIYMRRFFMDTPGVFAGLIVIMIIGLAVELLLFEKIEEGTVRKWGMVGE